MDKCENRRLEYLWGTFSRAQRKKKSIFFEKRPGEIREKYWARRFGERNRSVDFERRTRKNVLALKCLYKSALCKNDSPHQGIAYQQCAESQHLGCQAVRR